MGSNYTYDEIWDAVFDVTTGSVYRAVKEQRIVEGHPASNLIMGEIADVVMDDVLEFVEKFFGPFRES